MGRMAVVSDDNILALFEDDELGSFAEIAGLEFEPGDALFGLHGEFLKSNIKFSLRYRVVNALLGVVRRDNELGFDFLDKLERADGVQGIAHATNWDD